MTIDPNRTPEGPIAIAFIAFSGVLLIILLTTCIVCWCWRYKLHKRKDELKCKDAEQGIVTTKPKSSGCRCCGCWIYCCRCCRGCCEKKSSTPTTDQVVVVQPADLPSIPTGGCPSRGSENFGWSKDVYVYNNGPVATATPAVGGCGGGCGGRCGGGVVGGCGGGFTSSQPVNFNNRWSASNDGRLVLNGGGIASKISSGAAAYGGIYPSVPGGVSSNNQFMLYRK